MPRSALVLLCFLMPLAAARVHAHTVVVSADRMIDVIGGRAVEHPYVVITDGRISSISAKDTAVPPGAGHIDLPGITLLPGLIDMHVHLTSDPLSDVTVLQSVAFVMTARSSGSPARREAADGSAPRA